MIRRIRCKLPATTLLVGRLVRQVRSNNFRSAPYDASEASSEATKSRLWSYKYFESQTDEIPFDANRLLSR